MRLIYDVDLTVRCFRGIPKPEGVLPVQDSVPPPVFGVPTLCCYKFTKISDVSYFPFKPTQIAFTRSIATRMGSVTFCQICRKRGRLDDFKGGIKMTVDVAVIGGSAWFVGALQSVLGETGQFNLAASGPDALSVLGSLTDDKPSIVILACDARGEDVLELNRRGRRRERDIRIIVKFQTLRPNLVRDAMQAGAWGCFAADDSPETLLSVLTSVANGRASYPFVDFSLLKDDPFEQLTRRESEVLDALSQGWSNTQISSRLGISENTVKYHLKLIYGKLGVGNRATAIAQYMQRAAA